MPELGKYAFEVLAAYGASGVLIIGLVVQSWQRARRMRQALAAAEAQLALGRGTDG